MPSRVLFDQTVFHTSQAGVAGAAREMWDALQRVGCPDFEWIGIDSGLRRDMRSRGGVRRKLSTLRIDLEWSQMRLPLEAARLRTDVLVQPSGFPPVFSRVPVVAVVHDIFPLTDPGWFPAWQRMWARLMLGASLKRATRILASSEETAMALRNRLGVDGEKIRVCGLGVSELFRRLPEDDVERFRKTHNLGRYVLCVGSLEPRKNLRVVLDAVAQARETCPDLELVHVGPGGWIERDLVGQGCSWCRVMGHVSREELVGFYNAAAVFAFPSLAEGFGLPVLEAMACGTPVIHSDLPVLREISEGGAWTFRPESSKELETMILHALNRPDRSVSMRDASLLGRTWAKYAEALRTTIASIHRDPEHFAG